MFDVLVYLYENYWRPDACPEPQQLRRKLSAVGFETDEIQDALRWLDGLANSAEGVTVNLTVSGNRRGDAAGDRITGVENQTGSDLDDILSGTSIPNKVKADLITSATFCESCTLKIFLVRSTSPKICTD